MAQERPRRMFRIVAKYAARPDAPTLERVQADAAPLIAQLLAQAISKRQKQESA